MNRWTSMFFKTLKEGLWNQLQNYSENFCNNGLCMKRNLILGKQCPFSISENTTNGAISLWGCRILFIVLNCKYITTSGDSSDIIAFEHIYLSFLNAGKGCYHCFKCEICFELLYFREARDITGKIFYKMNTNPFIAWKIDFVQARLQ